MPTLFTRIVNGEIPCHKIAENDDFLAFLDINPLVTGHTLVIPKKEVDYIFDLDENLLSSINLFARDVAKKIRLAIPCKRIGVTVIGLEVPHAHIHLIPINGVADMIFEKSKMNPSQDELAATAEAIRNA